MATLLYRLGKTAYRRWPLFLAAWLVAMLAVGTVAATLSKPMTDAFSIPGIPSEKAADLQAELFPGAVDAFDQATVKVVVAAPEGHTLTEPTYSSAVDDLVADLRQLPQMPAEPALANPATAGPEQVDQMVQQAVENGTPARRGRGQRPGLRAALRGRPGRHHHLGLRRGHRRRRRARHDRGAPRRDGAGPRRGPDRRGQRLRHPSG